MNEVSELSLYGEYSRKDVHDIFSPETIFRPQTGQWGLNGVIRIEKGKDDFVFFVRLNKGTKYASGQGISEKGILTWLAPQQQDNDSPLIRTLTKLAHPMNKVYLFVRPEKHDRFIYFGNLKYESHDPNSMHPIEFKWRILNWPIPERVRQVIGSKS